MLASVLMLVLYAGCGSADPRSDKGPTPVTGQADRKTEDSDREQMREEVTAFCGACHVMPSPDYFPKTAWFDEVKQGFDLYYAAARNDLRPPATHDVVEFFGQQAPDSLVLPDPRTQSSESRLKFRRLAAGPLDPGPEVQAAAVSFVEADKAGRRSLICCDMRNGLVEEVQLGDEQPTIRVLAQLNNPASARTCDPDSDGLIDFVVGDLGSFLPEDHNKGRVVWLRREADGDFSTHVIAAELGRVCDVRPGDFDGDGDEDFVVAEFGWRKTGNILLLENTGAENDLPAFKKHVIDRRHGTIHVPVVDLNGDGHLDFVALISQEHEVIEAFFGSGDLTFRREVINPSEDPAYGSSGIELVDLDEDGDLDVLYTNGDTLDSHYLKPYHAVQWLENTGRFPFERHHITDMVGVFRALAGDLDEDGDLDIVAVAMLPNKLLNSERITDWDSVIWLEQVEKRKFVRHRLEDSSTTHTAFELADLDGDGKLDLAVGNFSEDLSLPRLSVWWNLGGASD